MSRRPPTKQHKRRLERLVRMAVVEASRLRAHGFIEGARAVGDAAQLMAEASAELDATADAHAAIERAIR